MVSDQSTAMAELVCVSQLTPLAFLGRSAEVFADKTAIIHGSRRITYREFAAEATRLADALRASGIGPGDRVAFLCPNVPAELIAQFAVPLAGGVLVAINTRLSPEEVRYILDHSGSKLLVVDAALLGVVEPIADRLETVREIVTLVDPEWAGPPGSVPPGPTYDELLARGTWSGAGVLGPEALDAEPFLALLTDYGSPWGQRDG